jgi:hypothetical protein
MKDYSHRKGVTLGPMCKHGHDHGGEKSYRKIDNWTCCECQEIRIHAWQQTERGKLASKKVKARRKEKANIQAKSYRVRTRSKRIAYNAEYRAKNKAWLLAYYRDYNAMKKAVIRVATPAWADRAEIKRIYKEAVLLTLATGEQYHVDHIVPIISDRVCGLHVPANLRIITESENCQKGNRWWPEDGGLNGYSDRCIAWDYAKQAMGVA